MDRKTPLVTSTIPTQRHFAIKLGCSVHRSTANPQQFIGPSLSLIGKASRMRLQNSPGDWTKFNQISTLPYYTHLSPLSVSAYPCGIDGTPGAEALITTLDSTLAFGRGGYE